MNIGLYLDKYIFWKENEKEEAKIDKMIRNFGRGYSIPRNLLPLELYEGYLERVNSLVKTLETQGYHSQRVQAKIHWRLAVNLGAASVYETSILFHRNYSIPIIPGSAVKGTSHHFAQKYRRLTDEQEEEIFGTQNLKGKVIFFDALPIISAKDDFVVLDVMKVHYRDYYEKGEYPGDWMSPILIPFLTVEKIEYQFIVTSKNGKLAENSISLVKEAIVEQGIGAKTSAGYGYFKI